MPDAVTELEDLPEWLVVDEILLRLPPKDVLRCRAVRKSWRAATCTDKFILNHHRRQPSLPIFHRHNEGIFRLVAAGDQKIQQVLEYLTPTDPTAHIGVMHHAACDGLLLVSTNGPLIKHATFYSSNPATTFYICNPATRKCAPLLPPPLRPAFNKATVVAFYRHQASGEHRVLWLIDNHDASGAVVDPPGYFVLPVGSDQPRCVQWPTHLANFRAIRTNQVECPPVHHRGGLHWALHWAPGLGIKVFDTDTETFRQMSRPAQFHMVSLHHLGGDLALCGTSLECVTLDVWALQDYDAEIWGFLYRIDLRVVVASPPLDFGSIHVPWMAVVNGRELLIQHGRYRILHCDIEGLYLGEVEIKQYENSWDMFTKYLSLTRHRLQESLISLPLFEMQEEDAVHHKPPFTIVL